MLQMIFTVYCSALLFIEANGGGTHVTSVPQLQLLTKVGILLGVVRILLSQTVGCD